MNTNNQQTDRQLALKWWNNTCDYAGRVSLFTNYSYILTGFKGRTIKDISGSEIERIWQAEGCPGKEQTPDPMDKWDDLRRAHTSAEQAICQHCGEVKKIESGLCGKCGKFPPMVKKEQEENDAREDDVYGRYPEPTESKNVDLAAENKALKEMCEQYERDNKVLLDRLNEVIRENNDMQNNNDQLTEALEYVINEISALPEKGNTGRTIVESLCLDKATAALSNTPQIETTDGSGAMAD